MRVKVHIRYTGYLVMNLQALETAIRAFLECRDGRQLTFPRPGETETEGTWFTKIRLLRTSCSRIQYIPNH